MNATARATLREHLRCQHERRRSYRAICEQDYGGAFSHTVLQRIVVEDVFPKDRAILKALGLLERKKMDEHTKRVRREINRMARATKEALKVTG
jgi:hypothetical protein